ncbi:hypothetical protein ACR9PT_08145 [Piscirickettsia salmonis]|uniref:hypothetical protein n=1 Tax=Piscirickettsia salmonis TaxID=1238 RepID=UPI003EBDB862
MGNHITLRTTEGEDSYLRKVAVENNLYKANGEPSTPKALKFLLSSSMKNRLNDSEKSNDLDHNSIKHIERLVEQMSASIPHLALNTFVSAQHAFNSLSDDISDNIQEEASKYLRETIGQFQDNNYNNIYISYNHRNMKTLPVDKEKNKWK